MFRIGLTDHLEGPAETLSVEIYKQVEELVCLADELGVSYAWFAEHHGHMHQGHLPAPLLFALHLAGCTRQIHLGSAVVCLNLHHPLDVAEQVAVADALSGGRLAPGFGSGSTDEEYGLFGVELTDEKTRHARFENALNIILRAWDGGAAGGRYLFPTPARDLKNRSWLAVNSVGAARIGGKLNLNMLFSHLRTVGQYQEYREAYRSAGGHQLIAANRPLFVAANDAAAIAQAEPALRLLWRRFREEGKIPRDMGEPARVQELCAHPINFIVGGPESVATQLRDLHKKFPFDILNIEVRWAALAHNAMLQSLRLFMEQVVPQL